MKDVGNQREGVTVFDSNVIKLSIVLDGSKLIIICLVDKEEWGSKG